MTKIASHTFVAVGNDPDNSVKHTFKVKTCKRYVVTPRSTGGDTNARCICGRLKSEHDTAVLDEALDEADDAGHNEWDPREDVNYKDTDAWGTINFHGTSTAKYIRLAEDSGVADVTKFMLEKWGLEPPKLVISVVGGAKGFDMSKWSGRWKRIMDAGLVKVAQDAGAWIITGGTNTGVMKAVGEAVQSGHSKVWIDRKEAHRVRCIGIWTWGYTKDADRLINKENNPRFVSTFDAAKKAEPGKPASLNPQHTHFLLVDDGTVGYSGGITDGLYTFRNDFEKHLSNSTEGCVTVPCVQLLVGGEGMGCIQQVRDTLRNGIPVVVCQNTGKACDLLCAARKLFFNIQSGNEEDNTIDENAGDVVKVKDVLRMRLRKAYPWLENNLPKLEEYLQWLCDCCLDVKLVTVFDFAKSDELDTSLFTALFEGRNTTSYQKFMFAYHWNRADIAEQVLAGDKEGEIERHQSDLIKMALEEEKVQMVEMLFKFGVHPKAFLTVQALDKLYGELDSKNTYPILFTATDVNDKHFSLGHVDLLINKIKGHTKPSAYLASGTKEAELVRFQDPFLELFLWAVLARKQDLAKLLWQYTEEPAMAAILAYHLLNYLKAKVEVHDSDIKELLKTNAGEFQKLANGLLDECYSLERSLAQDAVQVRFNRFNNENVLDMAAQAKAEIIIAHPACQNSLNLTWRRGLTSPSWLVILATIFPFLIPLKSVKFSNLKLFKRHTGGNPCRCFRSTAKIYMFYTSPIVKFTLHSMMLIAMCVLFSYFVLFGFGPHVTIVELILVAWTGTILFEEIRELIFMYAAKTSKKIYIYFSNLWNMLDLLGTFLVFLAFSLRWSESTLEASRTLYCLSCLVWGLRLLHIYTPSSYFGTKLIMIYKMLTEVVFFMLVMVVFLISYGVVSQALLYPNRKPYALIFKDVLYMPYWQIYGELFLDEMHGNGVCTNTTTATGSDCAQPHWLVPILLAVYLIIGNVLMLNLLIAIMSHVFEEVQSKSEQVLKSAIYDLVQEYEHKPFLPPPLIIISHLHGCLQWILKKCCRCMPYKKPQKYSNANRMKIRQFLNDCMENYVIKSEISAQENQMSILKTINAQQDLFIKEQKEEKQKRHFLESRQSNSPAMSYSNGHTSQYNSAFSMGDFHLGTAASENSLGYNSQSGVDNLSDERTELIAMQRTLTHISQSLDLMNKRIVSMLDKDM